MKIDLTNCEREPIHVLGNIQAFGFLVAVGADWTVTRVSANSAVFVGAAPEALLGRALVDVFTEQSVHAIRNRVTLLRGPDAVERLFNLTLVAGGPAFDVALHFSGDQVVIEAGAWLSGWGRRETEVTGTLARSSIDRAERSLRVASARAGAPARVRAISVAGAAHLYRRRYRRPVLRRKT